MARRGLRNRKLGRAPLVLVFGMVCGFPSEIVYSSVFFLRSSRRLLSSLKSARCVSASVQLHPA